ncbi:hypothetical protein [Kitasatospora sp. NPDC057223]|uniref:hypothetical protein n=1 Tax=Kitasatospora sp. NPDC057223 TaxID=3346055 RepID=UPI00363743FC
MRTVKWPVKAVVFFGSFALLRFAIANMGGSGPAEGPGAFVSPPASAVGAALSASLAAEAGAGWASVQAGVVARLDIERRGGQPSAEACAKEWSALSQGKRDALDEAAFGTGCDLTPTPLP